MVTVISSVGAVAVTAAGASWGAMGQPSATPPPAVAHLGTMDQHSQAHTAEGDFETNMVGGQVIQDQSQNPGAVSIAGAGMSFSCSASRIAPRWVLTAAHCAELNPNRVWTNSTTRGQGQAAGVTAIKKAPNGDVALLQLDSEPPGPVASYSVTPLQPGDTVNLYGWGMTDANGQPSQVLKTVTSRVVRMGTNPYYRGVDLVVAGNNGAPWKGDSGGPIFKNGQLVGACSWSSSYGTNANAEAGYGAIAPHAAWIQQTIGSAPGGGGGGGIQPPGGDTQPPGGLPPGGDTQPPGGGVQPPGGLPPGGGVQPPGGGVPPGGNNPGAPDPFPGAPGGGGGGVQPPGGGGIQPPGGGGFQPPGGGTPPAAGGDWQSILRSIMDLIQVASPLFQGLMN